MYHCGICNVVSEPREARKVHVLRRTDGSIAQEVPVCQVCAGLLAEGVPFSMLMKQHGRPIRLVSRAAIPTPRPPVGRPVPIVRPNGRG